MNPYTIVVGVANLQTLPRLMHTACLMAKQFGGRIVVASVVPPATGDSSDSLSADPMTQADQLLGEALATAQTYGVACDSTISLARQIHEGIVDVAVAHQAKVILVGFSERQDQSLQQQDYDRVIDALAAHSPCHLLVAKFRDGKRFNKVLVPVASELNLRLTSDIVTTLHHQAGASIDFIRFAPTAQEAEGSSQELGHWLEEAGVADCGTVTVDVTPEPTEAIVEASRNYDALIVGTPPLHALRRRLFGSVAEHIVNHAACTAYLVRSRESG